MTRKNEGALLGVTRVLIVAIMGLAAVVGVAIATGAAIVPFYWDEALATVAKDRPGTDTQGLLTLVYAIFALLIVFLGIAWTIMKKLLAIIATVAGGDPFVHANALRLKAIGWMMVAAQLLGIPLYMAAREVVGRFGERNLDSDFSVTGLLSILLVFVLAGVFEQGAAMREEMEGTV
jgi:Protein of unknown function (DUF2975)